MSLKKQAELDSPSVSQQWRAMDYRQRENLVNNIIKGSERLLKTLELVNATDDGQIIFKLLAPIPVNERANMLLDLESLLKVKIDIGLTLWLEPIGDKSSLRNLRGIEVKN